jgi:hypothetical protein
VRGVVFLAAICPELRRKDDEMDKPRWKWTKNGQFTVKSMYKKAMQKWFG